MTGEVTAILAYEEQVNYNVMAWTPIVNDEAGSGVNEETSVNVVATNAWPYEMTNGNVKWPVRKRQPYIETKQTAWW